MILRCGRARNSLTEKREKFSRESDEAYDAWVCSRPKVMERFMRVRARFVLPCVLILQVAAVGAAAQENKRPDLAALFEKKEVMIPVRDGVKLHTEIYTPKNAKEPLPILFERTPYGISAPNGGMSGSLYRYAHMFADGYIFVFQDIRGRYGSQGKFE